MKAVFVFGLYYVRHSLQIWRISRALSSKNNSGFEFAFAGAIEATTVLGRNRSKLNSELCLQELKHALNYAEPHSTMQERGGALCLEQTGGKYCTLAGECDVSSTFFMLGDATRNNEWQLSSGRRLWPAICATYAWAPNPSRIADATQYPRKRRVQIQFPRVGQLPMRSWTHWPSLLEEICPCI